MRRSSASPSPAPQTKLRLSGPFCYTHQCFICGILQRGITELFLVIVTDFLNNCYIIKIRKCKSHGYLINSYLAFCFLLVAFFYDNVIAIRCKWPYCLIKSRPNLNIRVTILSRNMKSPTSVVCVSFDHSSQFMIWRCSF